MQRGRRRSSETGAGRARGGGGPAAGVATGAGGAGGGVGGVGEGSKSPRDEGVGGARRTSAGGGEAGLRPAAQFSSWPSLPLPATHDPRAYMGPTEESNWVLPRRMLVGAFPGSPDDAANERTLTSILELGITTFVCLQQEYQHRGVTEHEWRTGLKLRPYVFDAVRLLPRVRWPAHAGARPTSLEFVHFPIVDCGTASDARVLRLARDLCARVARGENLYVHCWGGHGRTGTVVSLMLGLAYDLGAEEAMAYVQLCHDYRACPMGVPSPQTEDQRRQVRRILAQVQQARRQRLQRAAESGGGGARGVAGSGSEEKEDAELDGRASPGAGTAVTSPVPPLRLEAPRRSSLADKTSEPGHAPLYSEGSQAAGESGKGDGAHLARGAAPAAAASAAHHQAHVALREPPHVHATRSPGGFGGAGGVGAAEPDHVAGGGTGQAMRSVDSPRGGVGAFFVAVGRTPPPSQQAPPLSPPPPRPLAAPRIDVAEPPASPETPPPSVHYAPAAPAAPAPSSQSPRGRGGGGGRQLRVPTAGGAAAGAPPPLASVDEAWAERRGGLGGFGGAAAPRTAPVTMAMVQTPGRHVPGQGTVPDPAAQRAGRFALDDGIDGHGGAGAAGPLVQRWRRPVPPVRPGSGARRLLIPQPPPGVAQQPPGPQLHHASPRRVAVRAKPEHAAARAAARPHALALHAPAHAVPPQSARAAPAAASPSHAPALRRPSSGHAKPAAAPSLQQRLARDALLYGGRDWTPAAGAPAAAPAAGLSAHPTPRSLVPPVAAVPGNTAERALAYHVGRPVAAADHRF